MTLDLVPGEITVACNGREGPLLGAERTGMTAFCGRTFPTTMNVRLKENGSIVGELDFQVNHGGGSLRYVLTKAGHDTAFLLERH